MLCGPKHSDDRQLFVYIDIYIYVYLFAAMMYIYIYICFIQTALWHTLQHLHIAGISNALAWVDACHLGSQKPNQMVELD